MSPDDFFDNVFCFSFSVMSPVFWSVPSPKVCGFCVSIHPLLTGCVSVFRPCARMTGQWQKQWMTSPDLFFSTCHWLLFMRTMFLLFFLRDVSRFFVCVLTGFLCVHSQVCGLCVSIHLLLSGCVCRFLAWPLRQDDTHKSRIVTCLTCNFVLVMQTMFFTFVSEGCLWFFDFSLHQRFVVCVFQFIPYSYFGVSF